MQQQPMVPPPLKVKTAILGGEPLGLALAAYLSEKLDRVFLWLDDRRIAEELDRSRRLGPDSPRLPGNVEVGADYRAFQSGDWNLFTALSARNIEGILEKLLTNMDRKGRYRFAVFTKGLVSRTERKKYGALTICDYIEARAVESGFERLTVAGVGGSGLLYELKNNRHCFLTVGCANGESAGIFRKMLQGERVRVTAIGDRRRVDLLGLLKYPVAVACGMTEGLPDCGENVRGAVLEKGYREVRKLLSALEVKIDEDDHGFGLSEMVTACTHETGRNRLFGRFFVKEQLAGENEPGILERINLFINRDQVIEERSVYNKELIEGSFALGSILEIAREHNVEMPLFSRVFDILSHRSDPQELIALGVRGRSPESIDSKPVAREKTLGMEYLKGHDFQVLLNHRILNNVMNIRGMSDRIRRQAPHILQRLEQRLAAARESGNRREQGALPDEIRLWQRLLQADLGAEHQAIEEIAGFYIDEIADDYRLGMRETIIRLVTPLRFIVSGFRAGSTIPDLGGDIDEIRELGKRYNIFYTPTHRSHLDSVELAFGITRLQLPFPRYAAGLNLMKGPLRSWVLKSMGAYAVDREKNRNILYLECLSRYSTLMLESGIPSLVYPEGTRSRSGGIVSLKKILLSTAVDAYRNTGREVIVAPIALSYESVPEDEKFCGGDQDPTLYEYISKRNRVYMDFCPPIRISDHIQAEDPLLDVSLRIEEGWRSRLRVLPNQIMARLLAEHDFKLPRSRLEEKVYRLVQEKKRNYLHTEPTKIIDEGLAVLENRDFIRRDRVSIQGLKKELLIYYGNMIGDRIQEKI